MATAHELLRQGKYPELWQMCCGFLSLNIDEFMGIQERLLMQQVELLGTSPLGKKLLRGSHPQTVDEFRNLVPLTTYKDYCPELLEKHERTLPVNPRLWAHTAGRSGEYPAKWVPITTEYAAELSRVLFGVGILSSASRWGECSQVPLDLHILYSVAPPPFISGIFAEVLEMQSPVDYLPNPEVSKDMPFQERIGLGFQQAVSRGFDYFFGISLVLVNVGDRLVESSNGTSLRPFLKSPRALWRLGKGKLKSRLAGRPMLPRDLWKVKGIIGSGTDSFIFKDRIREFWGRPPLDLYSCTEGGVIATQTWDYEGMTFVPNLNFLEFIPEDEQLKNQLDRSYQPKSLLLKEVKAGENYEIVITNFHGNAVTRYRLGDMVKITALRNERLGIDLPQMAFERRVDDVIDLMLVRLTERNIWQAIEQTGLPYQDWVASKQNGDASLNIYIELKDGNHATEGEIERLLSREISKIYDHTKRSQIPEEYTSMMDLKINVITLPGGTFGKYTARKQAEGVDLAHLKPPHVNPPQKVLSILTSEMEETIVVTRTGAKSMEMPDDQQVSVS